MYIVESKTSVKCTFLTHIKMIFIQLSTTIFFKIICLDFSCMVYMCRFGRSLKSLNSASHLSQSSSSWTIFWQPVQHAERHWSESMGALAKSVVHFPFLSSSSPRASLMQSEPQNSSLHSYMLSTSSASHPFLQKRRIDGSLIP